MPRIAPSTKIREEITRLLQDGVPGDQDVTGMLLRLGAQRLAQELLEEEVTDFLGRDRYVRHRGTTPHRGYRNGYEPGRVRTAEGDIPLHIPQVRETPAPYQSRLLSFLRGHTDVSSAWWPRCTPAGCRRGTSRIPSATSPGDA